MKRPDEELLAQLEKSGMRRVDCEGCGCLLLTRGPVNKCPPCQEKDDPSAAPALLLPPRIHAIFEHALSDRMLELGGVLARMIELLTAEGGPRVTFGEALAKALAESAVRVHKGSDEETALITAAFQIVSSRKLPGAPDA